MDDVDAVLFDLDGTLCQHEDDMSAAYKRAFERIGVETLGEPSALWAALDGTPDPDDRVGYLGAGFARIAAQHGRNDIDPIALAEAFAAAVDEVDVELCPGATAALDAAAARGPTGIITNGPRSRQRRKVQILGLDDRVDVVIYAGDLPRRKPHAAPFREALTLICVPASRTLYVGNSLAYDVVGAQNSGLPVAWIRGKSKHDDPGAYRPEYVLDEIGELVGLLEGQ